MPTKGTLFALLCVILAAPAPARAQSLMDLLTKGPVVSVTEKEGRFENVLAVHHIRAPIETVWETCIDFERYPAIMPKVVSAEVQQVKPGVLDVRFEIEVPGVNPVYTNRYELSKARWQIAARWLKGDLKGSYNRWLLVPLQEDETLIYYTTASRNFNKMAQAFEDDQQTLTVGVNVSSALAVVKGTKIEAERRHAVAAKQGVKAAAPAPPRE
ncbi:MAG: SRPBCC family protein [Deltaproteobacteria bacterium]|nr:SRPBCC family protein [Deltaproteobacteria bacterium]